MTADINMPEGSPSGVLIAQGGAFGGWSLYVSDGRPCYCYNLLGITRTYVRGSATIASGHRQVRVEFDYKGGRALGGPATLALYVDGAQVGAGHLERTTPLVFSYDETTDVGCDTGSRVSDEYASGSNRFPGIVNWVQIEVGKGDADHLVSPEERWRVAMARQ